MFRNQASAIVDQAAIDPIEHMLATMPRFPRPADYTIGVAHALESWPKSLMELSFPSAGFELSPGEIVILMKLWGDVTLALEDHPTAESAWNDAANVIAKTTLPISDGDPMPITGIPLIVDLMTRVDALLADMATHGIEGPVFKLGTRSPKDSPFTTCSSGRVYSAAQVLLLIFTSNRMLGDIGADQCYNESLIAEKGAVHPDFAAELKHVPAHRTWFWFRAFKKFEPYQEFRCVMRNREFAGATQYHGIISDPRGRYFEAVPFPELVEHGYEYEKLILDWFPTFRDASPYDDAVFDVIVVRLEGRVILLETNPCGKGTFPGLMDWDRPGTFNGELNWVAEPIRYTAPVISQREIEQIREKCSMTPAPPSYDSIVQAPVAMPLPRKLSSLIGGLFGRKK